MDKYELANNLVKSDLIDVYDVLDMSYVNARDKEMKSGKLHKQMEGGLFPCIKTHVDNYGVVVYD